MSSTDTTIPHDWAPRPRRRRLFSEFGHDKRYRRGCAVWHRRAGKDSCALNLTAATCSAGSGPTGTCSPTDPGAEGDLGGGQPHTGSADHRRAFPPAPCAGAAPRR